MTTPARCGLDHANRATYQARSVVQRYAHARGLQPPEVTVLALFGEELAAMHMLDIGVGGGRTTLEFAPRVREYLGIDYSAPMIEACARRCAHLPNARFAILDARALAPLVDESFDFILFSFNGIDYVPHEDRLRALAEIRRVTRPGGWFCFSSHNIYSVAAQLSSLRLRGGPLQALDKLSRFLLIRMLNGGELVDLVSRPYAMIRDLPRLRTYYIEPREQLRQLHESGFGKIRIFSLLSGAELAPEVVTQTVDDKWLYYLCARQ